MTPESALAVIPTMRGIPSPGVQDTMAAFIELSRRPASEIPREMRRRRK
jgi:hypothetical protein